ncbi:MAG: MotA/TolQ/ExbB proton channel family protein, partial [Planctomycetota bacterium]
MPDQVSPYAPTATEDATIRDHDCSVRRIKRLSGFIAVACTFVSPIGTVIGMMRAFNSLASGDSTPTPADFAGHIQFSMFVTAVVLPFAIVAFTTWLACWVWLRRSQFRRRSTEVCRP